MIDSIRISEKGKRHLTTLKRHTGIDNWNILCRWGFCLSLTDDSPLVIESLSKKSNVEMTWKTFSGSNESIYSALLTINIKTHTNDNNSDIPLTELAVLHIERGLSRMLPTTKKNGVSGLLKLLP